MSALSEFDPKVVGEASALPGAVSAEEAALVLAKARVPELSEDALPQWDARSVLGRYLSQGGMGNLVVHNLQRRSDLEAATGLMRKLMSDDSRPDDTRLCAARSILESVNSHCKLADVELRLLEAASHGTRGKAKQSSAPSINAQVAYIQQNTSAAHP